MFYVFLSFGFGYGLWLKGQTFDCGRSWKLSLRFYTAIYQILFSADGEKTAEEEDEDLNGTGQLKKDVGFLFSGLEQEFEESKSARAKLRERIKKVKTAIKEADDAEATENGETITKESEEEKDKRRAELREKFRLQREAKKKAKAEAGQW